LNRLRAPLALGHARPHH
jgi:large subunit ribosomal protein L35